ncbi:MAG: transposase [Symbiobacteriia bacterium]
MAPDRVISVVDPEMRHGRKSSSQKFDGYKAHITAQQGGDGKPRLVTGVTVTPGNTPDGNGTAAVLAEREALTGHFPKELMGDTAYGGIQTRAVIAQQAPAVTLTAPVPPGSARAGQFPKAAFDIDLEAQTVTCPGGTAVSFRQRQRHTAGNHRQTVTFPLATCAACALRAQCVSGTGARTITIHPAEAQIQAERARQAAPAWQRHYRRRSEIEHVIRGLTRLRDRATHFYGQRKTEMQLIWQAIGYNIHELARFPIPRPGPA